MLATGSTDNPSATVHVESERGLVLQVEDNDCVASLVGHMLSRHGFRMLRAKNGVEGEQLFTEHAQEIAFVMLDCRLPDIDGAVLGRRLRQIRSDLPVLFTSGQGSAAPESLGDGNTGFLAKPFLPGEFSRRVNALLEGVV